MKPFYFLIALLSMILVPIIACSSQPAQSPAVPTTVAPTTEPQNPGIQVGTDNNSSDTTPVELAQPQTTYLGKIVFMSAIDTTGHQPQLYVMDENGSNWKRLTNNVAGDWWPDLAVDGQKITFNSTRDGNSEIYIMDADGNNQIRLTNNMAADGVARLSPDLSLIHI